MQANQTPLAIRYRPAVPDDFEFLYGLHAAAMRSAVEEAFGPWQEAWQRARFADRFDPAALQVIQLEGADVGVLQVQQRSEEIFLAVLEILPAYQRRGIGTAVVLQWIGRARSQGRPLALQVLKSNRPARHFYQRLGFGVTGETDTHYIMACYPRG